MAARSVHQELAAAIAATLAARRECLAVAESCTGGLIAKLLTDLPGSSAWFERGLVVYSNRAKEELLQVKPALLDRHGAVSGQVARAMARGLLAAAPVDWTVSVTGIAGPTGGTPDKPVGTVWIGWARYRRAAQAQEFHFDGTREQVRMHSANAALAGLLERLQAA